MSRYIILEFKFFIYFLEVVISYFFGEIHNFFLFTKKLLQFAINNINKYCEQKKIMNFSKKIRNHHFKKINKKFKFQNYLNISKKYFANKRWLAFDQSMLS
jgi:hypothetical protein